MTRARPFLLAVACAAAAGCTSSEPVSEGAKLRQPSAIAVFRGLTLHDPESLQPYLAIANAGRNDLTLVDARTDLVVEAPVRLRPLAVPFPDRPALLASADLGDGMADLLVGVSAGSSTLQLVRTWDVDNGIEDAQAVELSEPPSHEDVLALVALPAQPAGTARIVAALSDGRLAVVDYARDGEGIRRVSFAVDDVGFQASALATVPGDPGHVYAATLDPIGAGAIRGVGEIDVSDPAPPWPVRALDARGATRLVAGARLVERKPNATEANEAAFDGQTPVDRVYAVLDEGSCGPGRRIDCGVVALDPDKAPAAGDDHIPDDTWSRDGGAPVMPYRAPIRFEGVRPLMIAVAGPPAVPPTDTTYPPGFMRLTLDADSTTITTAVAVVATDAGALQFLDLGRFRKAATSPLPVAARVTPALPAFESLGTDEAPEESRLWLRDPSDDFPETVAEGAKLVGITPGYTPDANWAVSWQGILPGLDFRSAEAGWSATDGLWLAIQIGEGPVGAHVTSRVARLYHPALGVAAGDVVMIRATDAAGTPICTLSPPPGEDTAPRDFEATVAGLLPPAADRPGGALRLEADTTSVEWAACFTALESMAQTAALSSALVPRLLVTIRSGGLLLVRNGDQYAGRPPLDTEPPFENDEFVLQYLDPADPRDEEALAAACPLADWDGVFREATPPPACDTPTCRADCEKLVLARLVRRVHHLSESCETSPGVNDADCAARYPVPPTTFPFLDGPALKFRAGVEVRIGTGKLDRRHTFSFSTRSGGDALAAFLDGTTVEPNGALVFDRSPPASGGDTASGYRFFVSYPGSQVVDVSPSVSPVSTYVIR